MKYIVTRTSIYDKEKPCDEAIEGEIHYKQYKGNIISYKVWLVEVNDITKFIDKYGRIVIHPIENEEGLYEIEIYDDYRE